MRSVASQEFRDDTEVVSPLVGSSRRENQLGAGAQNDSALEGKVPFFEILKVTGYAILDIGIASGFAPETAHLGKPGNPGFHKSANVIVRQKPGELVIVFDEMRPRPNDAHIAPQHVPKLRDFIDTKFAEPFAQRINAFVIITCLPCYLDVIRPHRAEFVDGKLSILHAGANLLVKKRTGRLQPLSDPDDGRQRRKDEKNHRHRNRQIDSAF